MKAILILLLLTEITFTYQQEEGCINSRIGDGKEINEENCKDLGSSQTNFYCTYDGVANCVAKPYCTGVKGAVYDSEKLSKGEAFNCGDYLIKDDPLHTVCVDGGWDKWGEYYHCIAGAKDCATVPIPEDKVDLGDKKTFCQGFSADTNIYETRCGYIEENNKCAPIPQACSKSRTVSVFEEGKKNPEKFCAIFTVSDTSIYDSTCRYSESGDKCIEVPKPCGDGLIPQANIDAKTQSTFCSGLTLPDSSHYSICTYDSTLGICSPVKNLCSSNDIPLEITQPGQKSAYCEEFGVTDEKYYECNYDSNQNKCEQNQKECNNNNIPGSISQEADKNNYCSGFKLPDTNHYESCAFDSTSGKCNPKKFDCSTPRSIPSPFDGDKVEYCNGFSTSADSKACVLNESGNGCEEIDKSSRVACTEAEGGKCARLGLVDEPKIYKCTEKEDDPTQCELVKRTCSEGQLDSTKEDCRLLSLDDPEDADKYGCFVKSEGGCKREKLCTAKNNDEGSLLQADCDNLAQKNSYYHYICKVSTDGTKCEETQLKCSDYSKTVPEVVDDEFCGGFEASDGNVCATNADGTGCEEKEAPSQENNSSFIITLSLATFLAFLL